MSEVLFKVSDKNIIEIRKFEDEEYYESCECCGGWDYYTSKLILITDTNEELTLTITNDEITEIPLPSVEFLIKFFNDNEVQIYVSHASLEDVEVYVRKTLYIYTIKLVEMLHMNIRFTTKTLTLNGWNIR